MKSPRGVGYSNGYARASKSLIPMLEKPDLPDERILACLQDEYGLWVSKVAFLPLGADLNTAVYRFATGNDIPYFLKFRRGVFDEISVVLPKFLSDQGITQIIAPLPTRTGQLWGNLDDFKAILYPFVEGCNGYELNLSDRHWIDFGKALKTIHSARIPPALTNQITPETYSPQGRETVKKFLGQVDNYIVKDPVSAELAVFLKEKHDEILDLVWRAERLARALQDRPPESIACHSDIHAGNVLIDISSKLYIVDWDNPILAPKERDLMSIGGGLFGNWRSPQEEESLFYLGYGPTQINSIALAYYRYERIIQDIAVYCEQLYLSTIGGEDREQSLHYLKSNFLPNHTIEIACKSDKTSRDV